LKRNFLISLLLAVVILSGLVAVSFAGFGNRPLSLDVSVDRDSVYVGEPVRYSLVIRAGKGIDIELPDMKEALEGFAVKEGMGQERTYFGSRIIKKEYILKRYEAGDYTVPGISVKYRRGGTDRWEEAASREIKIKVKTLLPDDFEAKAPKIRVEEGRMAVGRTGRIDITAEPGTVREIDAPIRFPIKDRTRPRDVLILKELVLKVSVILGIVLFIALALFLFMFIRGRKVQVVYPHEAAARKLKALKDKALWEKGMHKEFCAELFSIMVHYIRDRFKTRSAEMTTEELLKEVDSIEGLKAEDKRYLKELIEACGFIKYTTCVPEEKQKALDLELAFRFVQETTDKEDKEA